jgi:hypothetical protein
MMSGLQSVLSPFVPAKAGTQSQEKKELGPRFRGDERVRDGLRTANMSKV